MPKDPYEVLGIRPGANMDEIKAAYHQMAKKYHPDQYLGHPLEQVAKERMQEINEAYQALQNMQSFQYKEERQSREWNQRPHQNVYYRSRTSNDSCCRYLTCMCCADTCCECMGGDFIVCC